MSLLKIIKGFSTELSTSGLKRDFAGYWEMITKVDIV